MARIYKKKTTKGIRWGYVVYVGTDPITGKEKRKYKQGFLTQKDAKLAAALVERQLNNNEFLEPSKITFGVICDEFLEHYILQGAKISSHRARKKALNTVRKEFEDIQLQKITIKMYQDLIDTLSKKYSENYISSIHSSSSMVFEYAIEMKLLKESPTKGAKLPKKKKSVSDLEKGHEIADKFLEKDELEEFLKVAKEIGLEGDLLCFTLLSYTGIRAGEMLALKWSDIDFNNHTLRIYKTCYNPTNNKMKYELLTPKTNGSIRTINFSNVLVELLSRHKLSQDTNKHSLGALYHDQDFIFTTNDGYPQSIKQIDTRLKRILKKTSITKNITPHSFRHTHTSLLIEANVHIKEIQERLGHSDINTTMDIYAHMTKNMKKEASTKFDHLMKNLSENLSD